jgi:hypothetical protein
VRGLQAHGVAATAKHYVAIDSQTNRFTVDVRVDEHTLHELYLAPFEHLVVAVENGRIPEAALDGKVRRILRLAARIGALQGVLPAAAAPSQPPDEVAVLLREATAATMVLVRNERDVLPLDRSRLRRVAIIGPNAAQARTQGGGSATVFPAYSVSPLEGLRAALGDDIDVVHAIGTHLQYGLTPVTAGLVVCPDCGEPGFRVRYLDDGGDLLRAEHRSGGRLAWLGDRKLHGTIVEVTARRTATCVAAWPGALRSGGLDRWVHAVSSAPSVVVGPGRRRSRSVRPPQMP